MKIFKQSIFGKVISLFLILAFSSYNVGFAATSDNSTIEQTVTDPEISVNDIGVGIDSGTVKSTYNGAAGKIIIHIQDAHCNYEAQQNISRMLDQFVRECGVDMISVEGAEGIVDTSWFKAFPDAAIRNEVATYFTKKGEMTGAELFSIISDYKGTIFGAENRDDYVKNLKAFTKTYPYKKAIENFFLNTRTVANRLKAIIYPPKLKELDLKIGAFDAKEIELSAFAAYLNKCLKGNNILLEDYPNFEKLVDTLEYERKIDFDIVDGERSQYIDLLGKKMSKEEMTELVTESIRFKKGHIKAVEFYTFLREQAKEYDIPIVQEFPNLFYYYLYTKLYDGIDNEGLFKEIDEIQTTLKDKLFTDDTQKTLDKYSTMIDMYVSLINIELTNGDYDLFEEYTRETSVEDIVDFLGGLSARYNLNYRVDSVPVQISENIPNMVEFYEVAMERDRVLVENTLREMDKENKGISVLITGGFHTKGMKDILEEKGISYVVVMPKITKDVETPYIQVLTNQRTSLEDILTDSAVPGAAAGISIPRAENTKAEGDILSPISFIWTVNLMFTPEGREILEEISREINQDIKKVVQEKFDEAVRMTTKLWLKDIKNKMLEEYGETEGAEKWEEFFNDNNLWLMLQGVYLAKVKEAIKAALKEKKVEAAEIKGSKIYNLMRGDISRVFKEFRNKERGTPGTTAVGKVLTIAEAKEFDRILRESFKAGRAHPVDWSQMRLGKLEGFNFVKHDGLIEALDEAGLPVNIHPGRGGDENEHGLLEAHIDSDIFASLVISAPKDLGKISLHELAHHALFEAEEKVELGRKLGKSEQEIENAIEVWSGPEVLDLWKKWNAWKAERGIDPEVVSPKLVAEAQEDFLSSIPAYNVDEIYMKIAVLVEKRHEKIVKEKEARKEKSEKSGEISREEYYEKEFLPLRKGTSGYRGKADRRSPADPDTVYRQALTDLQMYTAMLGELRWQIARGYMSVGEAVALAADLRLSTPRLNEAVAAAILEDGAKVDFCGFVPTPTVMYYAMQERDEEGIPSIMVTGSHIPEDENGAKINLPRREVFNTPQEAGKIAEFVAKAMEQEFQKTWEASMFDKEGAFKREEDLSERQKDLLKRARVAVDKKNINSRVAEVYRARYRDSFGQNALEGVDLVFEGQEKLVGKELCPAVLRDVGAEVTIVGLGPGESRSAMDTENISEKVREIFRGYARAQEERLSRKPLAEQPKVRAIATTDWDSDRPALFDEYGEHIHGDLLGILAAIYLKADYFVIPTTANAKACKVLEDMGVVVEYVKVGSPEVAEGMLGAQKQGYKRVMGCEVNGGFLLQSDLEMPEHVTLKSLPTRDAMLPIIAVILLAKERGATLSQLVKSVFSGEYEGYTISGLVGKLGEKAGVEQWTTGTEMYTIEMGKAIIRSFLPKEDVVKEVSFTETGEVEKYLYRRGKEMKEAPQSLNEEILATKKTLETYLSGITGLEKEKIVKMEFVDGVKIFLTNGEVVHLRPSGNAAQFRGMALTSSKVRSAEIVKEATLPEKGVLVKIIQDFAAKSTELSPTPGVYSVQPGVDTNEYRKAMGKLAQMIEKGEPLKTVPYFKTGADNYTWGQPVTESRILEMMGAETEAKKIAKAQELGIASAKEVISERWITAGAIDVGTGYNLPIEVLSLFPNEVFGPQHVERFGLESGITAKVLTSAKPLSMQIHEFSEMIIPLEDGYAYMGLSRSVTQEEFIEALRKGDISIFKKIDVRKDISIIVPAGMPHAYGEVEVYEVKAVNAAQDKTGTISFYDRLKWELLKPADRLEAETLLTQILETKSPAGAERATQQLVKEGYIREGKDVLTLTRERVREIVQKIDDYGFLKEADLRKVYFSPELIFTTGPSTGYEALYQIMGEAEGFSAGRYTIAPWTEIEAYGPTQGKLHSLFVTEGEVAIINEKGKEIDRLKQGEERIMPASIGKYTIHAIEGLAVVYTQYRPFPGEGIDIPEPSVTSFEAPPFETGRKITELKGVVEETVYAYEIATVFEETNVSDIIKIHEESEPSPIGTRTHVLYVEGGELAIQVEGQEPVVFEEGSVIKVSEEGIGDRKGTEIKFSQPEDIMSYKLIRRGVPPVEVKVQYAKTETEQAVYLITRMLKWALAEGAFEGKKIDLVFPKKIFGNISVKDAREWFDSIFGKDTVEVYNPYNLEAGLASAIPVKGIRKDAIGILGATETAIKTADQTDQKLKDFLEQMRTLAFPDIEGEVTDQSWFFVTAGTAVLQALLDADAIEKGDSIALRMERLMSQLTRSRVRGNELYYMLSYNEYKDVPARLRPDDEVNLFVWLMNLAEKLGLKPVKPFDPRARWEARLESLKAL